MNKKHQLSNEDLKTFRYSLLEDLHICCVYYNYRIFLYKKEIHFIKHNCFYLYDKLIKNSTNVFFTENDDVHCILYYDDPEKHKSMINSLLTLIDEYSVYKDYEKLEEYL